MNNHRKSFGKVATDKISGFEGIVTGFCSYITGCDQLMLSPKCNDTTEKPDPKWFDINRIEVSEGDAVVSLETEVEKGAMESAPIK